MKPLTQVKTDARRLRVARERYEAAIIEARKDGASLRAIAEAAGVAKRTVEQILARAEAA